MTKSTWDYNRSATESRRGTITGVLMTKSTWDYNRSATESQRDYNRSVQAKDMAGQCHKKSILCGSNRSEIYVKILLKDFT